MTNLPTTKPLLIDGTDIFSYDLGNTHPMGSDRIQLALSLARYFGVLDYFDEERPPGLAPGLLELVHTPEYIEAVLRNEADERFGLGTEDNPIIPGLPVGASAIVSGTVAAAQAVWSGRTHRAVHLAGGLHHAFADSMSGFCMYNDAAVALQWLLDVGGAQRLVYIDFDAHHGDGVERIFWDDPRVLTISVHESGLYLFPGTGFAHDIGGPLAAGTAVNLALPKDADDHVWLHTIHATIPPLLQKFKPQLILSQHGADPHRADPLADLQVSVDAMAVAYRSLRKWTQQYAEGRWVAIGGGGYNRDSVARTWTYLLATVADMELAASARLPRDWGEATSLTLGDENVDRSILNFDPKRVLAERPHPALSKTSQAVFPYWGLSPYA
ncbi:acetoin utilization protein AcuC [Corynebacterium ulceribovis]|uniref:acetoin utilization protein AcuC n=1 Tax=Corynebacterium ulceribovis TaxID=487732 RepID=UPI000371C9BC|nr:acetoin utilization protein AcuC [Corynebacterium ulceribovis]